MRVPRILLLTAALIVAAFSNLVWADIAHGTPDFTCTISFQNTDGSTIPATGAGTVTSVQIYLDGATTPAKTLTGSGGNPPVCDWQTTAGQIAPGNHFAQATETTAAGGESARTAQFPFVVPNPAPQSPTGLSVH